MPSPTDVRGAGSGMDALGAVARTGESSDGELAVHAWGVVAGEVVDRFVAPCRGHCDPVGAAGKGALPGIGAPR